MGETLLVKFKNADAIYIPFSAMYRMKRFSQDWL
jgi:hypothetical protein